MKSEWKVKKFILKNLDPPTQKETLDYILKSHGFQYELRSTDLFGIYTVILKNKGFISPEKLKTILDEEMPVNMLFSIKEEL